MSSAKNCINFTLPFTINDTNETNEMTDSCKEYRDYSSDSANSAMVKVQMHYEKLRRNQTVKYVHRMKKKYLTFDQKINIWDAFELLNQFVDASDPDLVDVPNLYHAFQTAEGIRNDNQPEWMQLVGLIHDLGKMLFVKGCDKDGTALNNQYGVGGDTFIVGCKLSDDLILPHFNTENPDMSNPKFNTQYGIYQPHCGFDNCEFPFGNDEYLYQVLMHNRNVKNIPITLPDEAFYIIRYHSFYPWHQNNAYDFLANDKDRSLQDTLKKFSSYDLYTKSYTLPNPEELKQYYTQLIQKYIGSMFLWF